MLIRYFKSSFVKQYLVLFGLMLVLWAPSYWDPPEIMFYRDTSPLWNILASLFRDIPLFGVIISSLLAFLSALLLNHILSEHGLIPRNSLLAGYIYILLIGSSFHFHQLNPIIVVNLLIILELNYLFQLYLMREAYKVSFSVGFITSLIFLIYPPAIYLIIPVYLIFMTMGNLSWREWVIPLIAFALPILYVAVYYFWIDKSVNMLQILISDFTAFKIFHFRFDALNWIKIGMLIPLFLVSLLGTFNSQSSKNIDQRKKTLALLHFFIFCSFVFLFVVFPYRQLSLLFVPVGAFISMWLAEKKKLAKYEILLILVILVSIIDNYKILSHFQ
ncbi:MAG: DUF6427 family protein [Bacteroidales bacterium]|nr:DUF6427 family protein [Bacteroidales bacterium]MCF8387206.1 DUF6427 family protein [Bacteroidales bacterium]MCF8396763.1 DUF6427 family protein [Bacteroidales bacterium]